MKTTNYKNNCLDSERSPCGPPITISEYGDDRLVVTATVIVTTSIRGTGATARYKTTASLILVESYPSNIERNTQTVIKDAELATYLRALGVCEWDEIAEKHFDRII